MQVLGDHIDQRGSIVLPDRLRFDFSHTGVVDGASLGSIEKLCLEAIGRALQVYAKEAPLAQAQAINGGCGGVEGMLGVKQGGVDPGRMLHGVKCVAMCASCFTGEEVGEHLWMAA